MPMNEEVLDVLNRCDADSGLSLIYMERRDYATIRARLVELESLLAGIDAEQVVTASEKHGDALGVLKDARRWHHARTILPVEYIEDSQREFESYGLPVSEEESIAADEAIDAAMHNSAREVGE